MTDYIDPHASDARTFPSAEEHLLHLANVTIAIELLQSDGYTVLDQRGRALATITK